MQEPDIDIEQTNISEDSSSSGGEVIKNSRSKHRTLGEFCQKIKTEENIKSQKIEEINSSDNGDFLNDGDQNESEDDPLLMRLQDNILGVLTYDKP